MKECNIRWMAGETFCNDLGGVYVQLMEGVDGNEDVSHVRVDLISSVATLQLLSDRVLKIQREEPLSASQSESRPGAAAAASIHRLRSDGFSHAGDRCIIKSGRLPIRTKGWVEITAAAGD